MYNWTDETGGPAAAAGGSQYVSHGGGGNETYYLYDATAEEEQYRRELGGSMGQYIAFQLFRILLPLMVFFFCFWCHDSSRRGRRGGDGGDTMTNGGGGGGLELTEEQVLAQEANRKAMLAETLVFKGVIETDEENPAPTASLDTNDTNGGGGGGGGSVKSSVVKGDIYISKSTISTNSASVATQLMEDPFADEEAPTCPICMVEYEAGETICWSPNPECTHAFHWECMSQWLLKHNDCPQCRCNYLSKSGSSAAVEAAMRGAPAAAGGRDSSGGGGAAAAERIDSRGARTTAETAAEPGDVTSSSTFGSTPPGSPRVGEEVSSAGTEAAARAAPAPQSSGPLPPRPSAAANAPATASTPATQSRFRPGQNVRHLSGVGSRGVVGRGPRAGSVRHHSPRGGSPRGGHRRNAAPPPTRNSATAPSAPNLPAFLPRTTRSERGIAPWLEATTGGGGEGGGGRADDDLYGDRL